MKTFALVSIFLLLLGGCASHGKGTSMALRNLPQSTFQTQRMSIESSRLLVIQRNGTSSSREMRVLGLWISWCPTHQMQTGIDAQKNFDCMFLREVAPFVWTEVPSS